MRVPDAVYAATLTRVPTSVPLQWDDAHIPRTDRPWTIYRTGQTPAYRWGLCRIIHARRDSFPFGPR